MRKGHLKNVFMFSPVDSQTIVLYTRVYRELWGKTILLSLYFSQGLLRKQHSGLFLYTPFSLSPKEGELIHLTGKRISVFVHRNLIPVLQ